MADYYTNISLIIYFGDEEEAKQALKISEEFEEGKHPEKLDDPEWPNTGCIVEISESTKTGLWIHSDESANLPNVAALIGLLLEKFEMDCPIGVEWANGCSKDRLDAYGGGAFVVYRGHDTKWMNTNMWLDQEIAELVKTSNAGAHEESEGEQPTTPSPESG